MTTAGFEHPQALYRAPRQDGGTRRMVLVAGALLGALLLAGLGAWAFSGRGPAAIPVVEADPRPVRVKPENPGGMQVAGADDQILSGGAGQQRVEGLAPPPEAPLALPARPAEPPPRPVQPAALTPATAPVSPPQAAAAPVPQPAAPPAAQQRPPAATGTGQVQLGALKTEDAARQEWARLSRRLPDLFQGRQPAITRLERSGQTLYRLRTGGFPDASAAKAFCDQVKAKGGACLPAT